MCATSHGVIILDKMCAIKVLFIIIIIIIIIIINTLTLHLDQYTHRFRVVRIYLSVRRFVEGNQCRTFAHCVVLSNLKSIHI